MRQVASWCLTPVEFSMQWPSMRPIQLIVLKQSALSMLANRPTPVFDAPSISSISLRQISWQMSIQERSKSFNAPFHLGLCWFAKISKSLFLSCENGTTVGKLNLTFKEYFYFLMYQKEVLDRIEVILNIFFNYHLFDWKQIVILIKQQVIPTDLSRSVRGDKDDCRL